MKKVIALICTSALLLFAFVPFSVEASDNILRIVDGYLQSSIQYAYDSLTDDQKDICDYLVGCYNLTYLSARGFYFNAGEITDFNSFQVTVKRLGQKIMNETGLNAWGSRMSDVFCQYVSSCIQYSQAINSNFATWYSNLPSDFSIPYGKENYDAWNNFYNDISNDGIASFQVSVSPWNSGTVYDFDFVGIPWYSSSYSNDYGNFVINNSPVVYTNKFYAGSRYYQYVIPLYYNGKYVNSLYLLRSNNPSSFRFAFNDNSFLPQGQINSTGWVNYQSGYNQLYFGIQPYLRFRNGILTYSASSYQQLIERAFYLTPFYNNGSGSSDITNSWWPYIEHVYLVDNLDTLSNKEEIYNVTGTDIYSNDTVSVIPKEDMLFYIKQLETDLPFPYPASNPVPVRNIVVNNTYNYYGEQADPSADFETAVIDRSAQSFSEPYSVDEGMFTQASEYIMYLWENTKPLILYTKDLLECLTISPTETDEETDGSTGLALAIYGSLAVGVAGGLISKLLL